MSDPSMVAGGADPSTPADPLASTLRAIIADVERLYPRLRDVDHRSDWARGVAWMLDRLANVVSTQPGPSSPVESGAVTGPVEGTDQRRSAAHAVLHEKYGTDCADVGCEELQAVADVLAAADAVDPLRAGPGEGQDELVETTAHALYEYGHRERGWLWANVHPLARQKWLDRGRVAIDAIAARVRAEAVAERAEIVAVIKQYLPEALGFNTLPEIVGGIARQRDFQHELKDHLAEVARKLTDERDQATAEAVADERQRIAADCRRRAAGYEQLPTGGPTQGYVGGKIDAHHEVASSLAAGSVPAATPPEPVDEVVCPNCEAHIRARMSDGPAGMTANQRVAEGAIGNFGPTDRLWELLADEDRAGELLTQVIRDGGPVNGIAAANASLRVLAALREVAGLCGMTGQQRVTDEQLTEWESQCERDPHLTSSQIRCDLIADLRESRARVTELVAAFQALNQDHDEWRRIAHKTAGQRDGLQQLASDRLDRLITYAAEIDLLKRRIDKTLALAADWAAKVSVAPSLSPIDVAHTAAATLRDALTGTEDTEGNPVRAALLAAAESHQPKHRDYMEGYLPPTGDDRDDERFDQEGA